MDHSFQSLIQLFLCPPGEQKALLIPVGCPASKVGIIFKEDYNVGFRFYVLHDPSRIQKYIPHLSSLRPPYAFPVQCPPLFTYKAQKKCFVLGIFNVTLHFDNKCAVPIFMVARAFSSDIALGELAPKEKVEGVIGSHFMLPIPQKPAKVIPAPNTGLLEFLLEAKIQTIQAKYSKCIELILDLYTTRSYDNSTFTAFLLFRGTLTELKHLALKEDIAEVARRSMFMKRGRNKDFAVGFLFPQDMQEKVVKELMPLLLANHQPCKCFRCTNKLDMHGNAEDRIVELLWRQNDEREQAQRNSKQANNGPHTPTMTSKSESEFPGLLELFREERTIALDSNTTSDRHCLKHSKHFIKDETNDKVDHLDGFDFARETNIDSKTKRVDIPSIDLPSFEYHDQLDNKAKPMEMGGKFEPNIRHSEMKTLDVWRPLETLVQRPTSKEARNKALEQMIRYTWNKSVEKEEPLRTCDKCGREDFELLVCNVCKASFFCNANCFKKAQKTHKKMCALIVDQRFKLIIQPPKHPQLPEC